MAADSTHNRPNSRSLKSTVSQMRLNPLSGRWVTIVAERAERPSDFARRLPSIESDPGRPCPFCPGNEEAVTPAYETTAGSDSWLMRVIPNRYPAYDGNDGFVVHHMGPVHCLAEASGTHDVFVYTPQHDSGLHDLSDEHAALMVDTLQRRLNQHADARNIRYSQIIVNHGREAGASVAHPHAQILGLPYVPGEVLEEERAFSRFAGGCLLCTTLEAEITVEERIVLVDDDVLCVAPFWSGTPYELLIIPREHEAHLQNATADSAAAMGRALRDAVRTLNAALGDVAFNVGFHTAPHEHTGQYHWHIHVWPTLTTEAGFERGTGVMINIVPPEAAAGNLRAARQPA